MEQETQLIADIKSGKNQAFQELVAIYSRRLYAAAYRILNDQALAEDCIQEVFIKVYRRISEFDGRSKLSTWLYSITVNSAIDIQRSNTKHHQNRAQPIAKNSQDEVDMLQACEKSTPESHHWQKNIADLTESALELLNQELRLAFQLKHFEGRSIEEISQILGINPNTVKNRIFRAVKQLRNALAPQLAPSEVPTNE